MKNGGNGTPERPWPFRSAPGLGLGIHGFLFELTFCDLRH